jgi:hypothetical protein
MIGMVPCRLASFSEKRRQEAFEEAGVIGYTSPNPFGMFQTKTITQPTSTPRLSLAICHIGLAEEEPDAPPVHDQTDY